MLAVGHTTTSLIHALGRQKYSNHRRDIECAGFDGKLAPVRLERLRRLCSSRSGVKHRLMVLLSSRRRQHRRHFILASLTGDASHFGLQHSSLLCGALIRFAITQCETHRLFPVCGFSIYYRLSPQKCREIKSSAGAHATKEV